MCIRDRSRVLGPQGVQAYSDMLQDMPPDPMSAEFDALPADADDAACRDLAERTAPFVRELYRDFPGLHAANSDTPNGKRFAQETMGKAMIELYNPAQIKVLVRLEQLLAENPLPRPENEEAP